MLYFNTTDHPIAFGVSYMAPSGTSIAMPTNDVEENTGIKPWTTALIVLSCCFIIAMIIYFTIQSNNAKGKKRDEQVKEASDLVN